MSNYKYVYKQTSGKFKAQMQIKGKLTYVGLYTTAELAHRAILRFVDRKNPSIDSKLQSNFDMIAYLFNIRKKLIKFGGNVDLINSAIFFHKQNVNRLEIIHDRNLQP